MNEWIEKYEKLADRFEIEKLATSLTPDQLIELLNYVPISPKLTPLLMGIGTQNFRSLLKIRNDKIETLLKMEAHQEPVQLHLTLLNKIWEEEINLLTADQLSILRKIHTLPLENLSVEDISAIQTFIQDLKRKVESLIEEINQGLKLAWNSEIPEVVAKTSLLKDVAIRILNQAVPSLDSFLKNRLESVFGPTKDQPGLNDSDRLEEGLARLGLWQMEDFYGVGLSRNSYENMEDLMHDLHEAGLKTIKDLKTHSIFSKPLFNYWIAAFNALKT
jgi:flagellar biosynthesis chaperone FliJ